MLSLSESRPHLLLAWRHLEMMLDAAQFVTSHDAEESHERRHFSANINTLTMFTKPLTKSVA